MARDRIDLIDPPPEVAPDALNVLARDHRLIEELLAELGRAAAQQIDPLARRICKMVRVHLQIEEELLYPIVSRALTSTELIATSEREHGQVREAVVRVESLTSEHSEFNSAMAVLSEQIAQHVSREEQELFPLLRAATLDLVAIGVGLAERRDTLLDVLGLHGDDEEGAANQRETHQPSAPRPSADS
ncbi:MAG: hemerythrin domain-containing protein [Steroidobacteraceae bacterium]